MDLLIVIIISGMAVGFSTELVGALVEGLTSYSARILKQILAAPLGGLFCWLLGLTEWTLLVGALASAFFALSAMFIMNRPINVQQVITNRTSRM